MLSEQVSGVRALVQPSSVTDDGPASSDVFLLLAQWKPRPSRPAGPLRPSLNWAQGIFGSHWSSFLTLALCHSGSDGGVPLGVFHTLKKTLFPGLRGSLGLAPLFGAT